MMSGSAGSAASIIPMVMAVTIFTYSTCSHKRRRQLEYAVAMRPAEGAQMALVEPGSEIAASSIHDLSKVCPCRVLLATCKILQILQPGRDSRTDLDGCKWCLMKANNISPKDCCTLGKVDWQVEHQDLAQIVPDTPAALVSTTHTVQQQVMCRDPMGITTR